MHIALIVSLLRGSHLLVDWHNYGHTILSKKSYKYNPLPWMYKQYECFFGKIISTANLSVTDAMAGQLKKKPFNIKKPIFTLHDRPAAAFQPIKSVAERKAFLSQIPQTRAVADQIIAGTVRLIVSSTSWTPDEDFSILLDALVGYAASSANGGIPIPILAVITGKGEQKKMYEDQVKALEVAGLLSGIRIMTAWLSVREYAGLLACADLGISLHKSTSGVDLPMKIVDMFGAGLPVAAYSAYESFSELVKEGVNGRGFETAEELSSILQELFISESGEDQLKNLKKGAIKEGSLRWDEEWDRVVGRLVGVIDP
jgi:beta-1,4-mannosyltransferase